MPKYGTIDDFIINGQAFTVTTGLVKIDTNIEKPMLLLKNTSEKLIQTTHFKYGTDSTSVRTIIRVYADPTVTANGTALTNTNTLVGTGVPASLTETYKFPTVTDNGGILNMAISPANSPATGFSRTYYIKPGGAVLVTIENSSSNVDTYTDIYWLEEVLDV